MPDLGDVVEAAGSFVSDRKDEVVGVAVLVADSAATSVNDFKQNNPELSQRIANRAAGFVDAVSLGNADSITQGVDRAFGGSGALKFDSSSDDFGVGSTIGTLASVPLAIAYAVPYSIAATGAGLFNSYDECSTYGYTSSNCGFAVGATALSAGGAGLAVRAAKPLGSTAILVSDDIINFSSRTAGVSGSAARGLGNTVVRAGERTWAGARGFGNGVGGLISNGAYYADRKFR